MRSYATKIEIIADCKNTRYRNKEIWLTALKRFARMTHSARMANTPSPSSWPHARHALEQAEFFISHTALVAVFLVCIWAISWLLHTLGGTTGDPQLFDRISLRYFFDALDAAVLLVFAASTVRTAIVVFWVKE
jgi:hypothetical protein